MQKNLLSFAPIWRGAAVKRQHTYLPQLNQLSHHHRRLAASDQNCPPIISRELDDVTFYSRRHAAPSSSLPLGVGSHDGACLPGASVLSLLVSSSAMPIRGLPPRPNVMHLVSTMHRPWKGSQIPLSCRHQVSYLFFDLYQLFPA